MKKVQKITKKRKKFLKEEITIKVTLKETLIKAFIGSIAWTILCFYILTIPEFSEGLTIILKIFSENQHNVEIIMVFYPIILIVCLTCYLGNYTTNGGFDEK